MKFHFNCPACNHRLSFAIFFLKLTRLRFYCPHCRTLIYAKHIIIELSLLLFSAGFMSVLYLQRSYALKVTPNFFIPILLVVLYEIAASLIACNKASFYYKTKSSKAEKMTQSSD